MCPAQGCTAIPPLSFADAMPIASLLVHRSTYIFTFIAPDHFDLYFGCGIGQTRRSFAHFALLFDLRVA